MSEVDVEQQGAAGNQCYIPDLCTQPNVLAVVLMAELVAMVYTLARFASGGVFLTEHANNPVCETCGATLGLAPDYMRDGLRRLKVEAFQSEGSQSERNPASMPRRAHPRRR